jgi:hypothetical protein
VATADEAGTYLPNALAPAARAAPSGGGLHGGVTPQTSYPTDQFVCVYPYTPVESGPSDLVTGNCTAGNSIWQDNVSNPAFGHQYFVGYVGGNYNGCGWIRTDLFGSGTPGGSTTCWGATSHSDFIYNDGTREYIWSHVLPSGDSDGSSYGNDGRYVGNKNCTEYANFRPWASGQTESDGIRPTDRTDDGSFAYLKLRYETKYASANTGNNFIMVHDPDYSIGYGDWVFVENTCLTNRPVPGSYGI